jgi:hypothetical protein
MKIILLLLLLIGGVMIAGCTSSQIADNSIPSSPPTAYTPSITESFTILPTRTTSSLSSSSAVCDCSSNLYNCADFATQADAQKCYDYCISQGVGDIHRLDADHDGIACEDNPSGSSSTVTYRTTSSSSSGGGSGGCPVGECYVNGYYRKSGTYVNAYCRRC